MSAAKELPEVLTVDELAKLMRVHRKTAYAAIRRGDVPGVHYMGAHIRISRKAVIAWLPEGQRRGPRNRSIR